MVPERVVDQQVPPGRARLAHATRDLLDVVVDTGGVSDGVLGEVADAVERATVVLRDAMGQRRDAVGTPRGFDEYLVRNRLVGLAQPTSPAGWCSFSNGVLEVRATFRDAHEGPEGFVHGGVVALVFDELLALATAFDGEGGMTGKLAVRYRQPTPLRREVALRGWVEHREGRRVRARGTIHDGETLCAEAEGLFVAARRAPDDAR